MNNSRFYLCAIPKVVWEQPDNSYGPDLVRFVQDALGCERRIAKEVNLENEFTRYTLTCQRIEQEIMQRGHIRPAKSFLEFQQLIQAQQLPVLTMFPGYLTLLSRTRETPSWERLGASFFPPETISPHRHSFKLWVEQQGLSETPVARQRLAFLEWIEKADCGLVELQTGFHTLPPQYDDHLKQYTYETPEEKNNSFVEIPEFETTGIAVELFGTKGRKQHIASTLRKQIRQALQTGEAVTFGNQAPHDVITEVLHEFVFIPPETDVRSLTLRVAYADGSEARPFPLFCLHQHQHISHAPGITNPLRVALMSMRHMELDPEIDFCWFRNREVSRTRTLAETDQFCFEATLEQFKHSLKSGELSVQLFHTGFEPAVIGFYRGLVQTLLDLQKTSSPRLAVTPYYFRGGNDYQAGMSWG